MLVNILQQLFVCRLEHPARMGHSGSMKVDVDASAPSGKTLQRLPTRRRRVQERLASLDTNQDGVVSKEELARASCYTTDLLSQDTASADAQAHWQSHAIMCATQCNGPNSITCALDGGLQAGLFDSCRWTSSRKPSTGRRR